jgi:hypothetical protein
MHDSQSSYVGAVPTKLPNAPSWLTRAFEKRDQTEIPRAQIDGDPIVFLQEHGFVETGVNVYKKPPVILGHHQVRPSIFRASGVLMQGPFDRLIEVRDDRIIVLGEKCSLPDSVLCRPGFSLKGAAPACTAR